MFGLGMGVGLAPQMPVSAATPFYGLSFDGGDYVEAGSNPISGATALSVCGWVYATAASGTILCWQTTGIWGYVMLDAGRPTFALQTTTSIDAVNIGTYNTTDYINRNVFVGAHWEAGGKAYINTWTAANGWESDETAGTLAGTVTTDGNLRLGGRSTSYLTGTMWQWKASTSALSEAQIKAQAFQTAPVIPAAVDYQMQPGSGSTLTDGSGNSVDGTLPAAPSTPTWVGPHTLGSGGPQ